MTSHPSTLEYIVDASIGAKWFVREEDSDKANVLRDALVEPETKLHIPQLFYVEIANILWKAVRRKRIEATSAHEALSALHQFGLRSHNVEGLAVAALRFALDAGIPAYDATYVALSAALDVPLITADAALHRQVRNRIDVRLLSEWDSALE